MLQFRIVHCIQDVGKQVLDEEERGITKHENQVDIDLNEWIGLKAVIEDEKAIFYLNDDLLPLLVVDQMIHDKSMRGYIGFFVDIGTEAFFKDLKITYFD